MEALIVGLLVAILFKIHQRDDKDIKDNKDLKELAKRNYRAEKDQGRIREDMEVVDHLSAIAEEFALMEESLYVEEVYTENFNPENWNTGSGHMAGIILAVTNMAEYYGYDILDELRKKTERNEQRARG